MIWKRLKNLWILSEYSPKVTESAFTVSSFLKPQSITELEKNIFPKKKQRLATIISNELSPIDAILKEHDTANK